MPRRPPPQNTASPPKGTSRGDWVHAQLRDAIRQGRFAPGTPVRESDVAEWLGVSRTPVREALKRLQSDGLVASVPFKGVVVADLDQARVVELYAMRRVLEGAAAALAARHAAPSEVSTLADLAARGDGETDPETLAASNRQFHETIYAAARNRYLLKSLDGLDDAMAVLGPTTYQVPDRPEEAHAEHRAIVDAIRAGDAEAAERAARDHIAGAERARLKGLNG